MAIEIDQDALDRAMKIEVTKLDLRNIIDSAMRIEEEVAVDNLWDEDLFEKVREIRETIIHL